MRPPLGSAGPNFLNAPPAPPARGRGQPRLLTVDGENEYGDSTTRQTRSAGPGPRSRGNEWRSWPRPGADSLFEVENPNVIDASTLDPVADGAIFAAAVGVFQDALASSYGDMIVLIYTAWFTARGPGWGGHLPHAERVRPAARGLLHRHPQGSVLAPSPGCHRQGEQVIEILGTEAGQEAQPWPGGLHLDVWATSSSPGRGLLRGDHAGVPGGEPGVLMTSAELPGSTAVKPRSFLTRPIASRQCRPRLSVMQPAFLETPAPFVGKGRAPAASSAGL